MHQLEARVERVGENGVADGLLIDRRGDRMYVASPEDDSVKVRELGAGGGGTPAILVQDERLRWPDTFAQGPHGALYATTSRIQDSAMYDPEAKPSLPTQLWRVDAAAR